MRWRGVLALQDGAPGGGRTRPTKFLSLHSATRRCRAPTYRPRVRFAPSGFLAHCRVFAWVKENLPRAKTQGAESAEQHRRRQNDAKAHTGNQVYSCGSLAPKLKKGGCSDCEVCVARRRVASRTCTNMDRGSNIRSVVLWLSRL